MYDVLAFAGIITAVFTPLLLKFEHRLTKVESETSKLNSKVDVLLEHNGLNPADCVKKSEKRGKNA